MNRNSQDSPRGGADGRPVILFVEAEQWERDRLVAGCRHHCRVEVRPQRLEELDDADIPAGVRVLSPFVHSRVDAAQLERLGSLELVATRSTGTDHIDVQACSRRGIGVCNVPTYGENTVAEHTFAILLALTRKVHRCYERTIRGDFSIEGLRGRDLYGTTFGCVGTGNIGENVLRIARGFGMRLLAFDVRPRHELARELGAEYVSMDRLLGESDVVSLHVPLNKHTRHMIDRRALEKMKPSAILVNTSRGGVVDGGALLWALQKRRIGGAALDVLEAETKVGEEAELVSAGYDLDTLRDVVRNHALLRLPNVIITPHVAFNSEQALQRIIDTTLENIHDYLAGQPQNLVNAEALSLTIDR